MITSFVLAAAVYWSGNVVTPGGKLPVSITLDAKSGLLDAPALGYTDKPIAVAISGSRVHVELRDDVLATADATIAGEEMRGVVAVGDASYPIELRRAAKPARNYRTEDLSLRNADVTLSATLYLPAASRPVPAIVFVAGLIPRSDSVHFLADRFASNGIAVLTYDRRGLGKSTGDPRSTFSEHASDAAAAIEYLRQRKDIDPNRIGIRGQSQGAWLAPLAASRAAVAFIIATGGGGVKPWESETYAIPARMRADGFSETEVTDASRYMEKLFEVARTGKGWDELSAMMDRLRSAGSKWFGKYGPVYPSLERLQKAWQGDFAYDPAPALQAVKVPYLALQGEKDVYSPPQANAVALERLLTTPSKTVRIIRGATHDFHVAGAPLPLVSDEYLATLMNWTKAQTEGDSATRRVVDHSIVSSDPKLTIDVDPSLRYIGTIAFDIRTAAHAERIIFGDADPNGRIHRLWIAQFERMLPQHQGTYDKPKGPQVRIGPFDFEQAAGAYTFAAAIAAKPGAEADLTRDYLRQKALNIDNDLVVARFQALTDASMRSELIVFYWEERQTLDKAAVAGFAERAKKTFAIH